MSHEYDFTGTWEALQQKLAKKINMGAVPSFRADTFSCQTVTDDSKVSVEDTKSK
jgi:hypothetical protein